jgi:hypothetical protein
MPTPRIAIYSLLFGFIAFGSSGCLMQRTVKDGDSVVARGYVVKAPIIGP